MHHVIVYADADQFAGWPANNGLWAWEGRELLVGFVVGPYVEQPGHNIAEPYRCLLARSRDGGESWSAFQPANYVSSETAITPPQPPPADLDLTGAGLALRMVGNGYHGSLAPQGATYVSRDRGATWTGPCAFGGLTDHPELRGLEITARTDYLVEGPHAALVGLSARGPGSALDRAFCARTADAGRSFTFLSWIVPPSDPYRGVMPATVRCWSGRLVSAVRRREPQGERCWIEAYASDDEGASWRSLGVVGETGPRNGNPPALVALGDGRLCCVYGRRDLCRMVARLSADEGATWGEERVLRADFVRDRFGDPDLGYPRVAQRADGRLVAIYYWATAERPQQHIAATIWAPDEPGAAPQREDG